MLTVHLDTIKETVVCDSASSSSCLNDGWFRLQSDALLTCWLVVTNEVREVSWGEGRNTCRLKQR